ncbi:hypothetical protein A6770_00310 [Nostoc minutum NIES-26]|uniref:Membrane protein insertion efficiency factor YidD n=1 Tax=Nostoc minutum NIES-26 TaxID=1844469 RepID=A0A367QXL8_9NOSO|nr:membrane protein insertion efficiency factor YidD [Dendronalium sp. ChiSLP03b]MDZ8206995.1 membrane protein insertion efficiency factor YidD [Dendronalium sp. ChiSLP03b]RCJ28885.1 hypothetical protein A6770_00310 [Nostoc minutum NIES-26]
MEISLLDSITRQVSIIAIRGYQKHISPHKGFACAHRVLYGGESCSQYIKRAIAQEGLIAAVSKSRVRFQACKQANQVLMSEEDDTESTEEEASNQQRPKKVPGKATQSSSISNNSGDNTYCPDCADFSCNCIEIVNVIPDCGSLDCGSTDCNFLDCGSADCNFLDCGSCGN